MADTDKDNLKAEKEAEKAAKKAKQDRIKQSKPKKDGTFISRTGKSVKKFWKDFTGTVKKIVWPGRTQVLKSSAIVLASIVVVGLVIFGFDRGLNALFSVGEDLAENLGAAYGTTDEADEKDTDAEETEGKETDAEETDADETKADETEADETEADETEADETEADETEGENTDAEGEESDEG